MSRLDLVGQRFGRLLVKSFQDALNGETRWLCLCDCENEKLVVGWRLTTGITKSCGCAKSRFKDIPLGKRFGRLVVVELVHRGGNDRSATWKCKCDCGDTTIGTSKALRTGDKQSCGCRQKDHAKTLAHDYLTKHGHTVGKQNSPEYSSWRSMIHRCTDPNNNRYELYGGRGVRVCERWLGEHGFGNFLADMGERPDPKRAYSLDRWPNRDGNYEPSNCRWATRSQQMTNRRPFQQSKRNFTSSKFKGVTWLPKRAKWMAQITANKIHTFLGEFRSEEAAARAYDTAATEIHGIRAFLNFPVSQRLAAPGPIQMPSLKKEEIA